MRSRYQKAVKKRLYEIFGRSLKTVTKTIP